jgi:hypothetical protein
VFGCAATPAIISAPVSAVKPGCQMETRRSAGLGLDTQSFGTLGFT